MSEDKKKDEPKVQKGKSVAEEVDVENVDPKDVKETVAEEQEKTGSPESGDKPAEEKAPEPAEGEEKKPAKKESPQTDTEEPAAEKEPEDSPVDTELAASELDAVLAERTVDANTVEDLEPALRKIKLEDRDGERYVKLEDLERAEQEARGDLVDLEKLYDESLVDIREQQIVGGKIIAISDKEVAVDIGFKSEGVVPIEEFEDPTNLSVGDQIEVYLESVEDSDGQLSLSKRKADFMRVWERVKAVYAADGIIKGRCTRRIKGGMVVDLGGVDAFLPGSQIDVRPVRDFDAIIGTEMDFKILKINDLRKNIVVSHKVLKEESLREVREKLLEDLDVGQVLEGTVKNITDFGVFVDLGGVDGLLHITDLSWGRVAHPSEVVQLDQKIKVMVLNYDSDRKRISLGLKQLYSHLWNEIDLKYRVGQKVQGKVVSLAKYGAFVEVEPGIEGLVHISEMSWTQHIKHPNQVVREGEYVQVVILNIDKENKKISLGLKQTEEDPWEAFEAKYRENTKHKGVVRDLVPFGAFVELEDGIDGLVHISDLSWTRKVRHPGEILKKGQEIDVVVLGFDRDERRIALGHKQIEENPWDAFSREFPVGTKTTGTVARLIDKGLIVEVPHKIEGFMPNSQISRKFFDGKKRNVQVGDVLNLVITEFDKEERKVILSNAAAEKDQAKVSSSTVEEDSGRGRYAGGTGTTIGDTLGDDLKAALERARAEETGESKEEAEPKAKGKKAKASASAADTEEREMPETQDAGEAQDKEEAAREAAEAKVEEAAEAEPEADAKKAASKAKSASKTEETSESEVTKEAAKKAKAKDKAESEEKEEAKDKAESEEEEESEEKAEAKGKKKTKSKADSDEETEAEEKKEDDKDESDEEKSKE